MIRIDSSCEAAFSAMGKVFNANTPEDHPVVFTCPDDFKKATTILAICTKTHPEIRLYAFQIMNNHIHLIVSGNQDSIIAFWDEYTKRLNKSFDGSLPLEGFTLKLFEVLDINYLRNAIAYVNRNGFVVTDQVTPFSYPWGTSEYYFNEKATKYADLVREPIGINNLRSIIKSRQYDSCKDLQMVDGFAYPMNFCDILTGQSVFRSHKQYFNIISRKVEAYSEIANSIGESIFYTDNDLFIVASSFCANKFGINKLVLLNSDQKIELALFLRKKYNATNKQISRLLRINLAVIDALLSSH